MNPPNVPIDRRFMIKSFNVCATFDTSPNFRRGYLMIEIILLQMNEIFVRFDRIGSSVSEYLKQILVQTSLRGLGIFLINRT